MKKLGNVVAFVGLGLVSFCFFLYLTFPYEVLKETLVLRASEASGMTIHADELTPSFPLGLQGYKLKIANLGQELELEKAKVKVGFFSLFLGKLRLEVEMVDTRQGVFNLDVALSLIDLLREQSPLIPSHLYVEAKQFLFGQLIDFILNYQARAPDVNLMVKPLLESVDVDGQLDANIQLNIDTSDLKNSEGQAMMRLQNAVLKSLNPNITIPDQSFSKFLLKASLKNGQLTIADESGLESQDLTVGLQGKIVQKPQLFKSLIDLTIALQLGAPLQEQLGFIIDSMTQRETNGRLTIKISGALVPQPSFTFL